MKMNNRKAAGFTLVELLVVIAIIVALAGFATPALLKQRKKADMTEAVNNAKQIYYLMFDFDSEFGGFPSQTADLEDGDEGSDEQVSAINSDYELTGDDSNAYFLQFFAADYTESEEIFYAKAKGTRKPDGDIEPGEAINGRECGFAYIAGQSTADNGSRPIVMTPMATGGGSGFDKNPFDGRAVVLRIDGSVKQLRINDQGDALVGSDALFESPIWDDPNDEESSFDAEGNLKNRGTGS